MAAIPRPNRPKLDWNKRDTSAAFCGAVFEHNAALGVVGLNHETPPRWFGFCRRRGGIVCGALLARFRLAGTRWLDGVACCDACLGPG